MNVKCKNCAYAEWQRTAAGNIRRSLVGRCTYVPPPAPVMLHRQTHADPPSFKPKWDTRPAIWMYYEGRCDVFSPLLPDRL